MSQFVVMIQEVWDNVPFSSQPKYSTNPSTVCGGDCRILTQVWTSPSKSSFLSRAIPGSILETSSKHRRGLGKRTFLSLSVRTSKFPITSDKGIADMDDNWVEKLVSEFSKNPTKGDEMVPSLAVVIVEANNNRFFCIDSLFFWSSAVPELAIFAAYWFNMAAMPPSVCWELEFARSTAMEPAAASSSFMESNLSFSTHILRTSS